MSHYIDTTHPPHGGLGRLSVRRRWEIVIGIVVAVALGVAALAFVNNTESPVADPIIPSAVGAAVGSSSLTMVTHGALDPFEMQSVSPQLKSAAGAAVGSSSLTMVTHGALDPFEMQSVSPPVDPGVGAPSDLIAEGPAYPRPEFR